MKCLLGVWSVVVLLIGLKFVESKNVMLSSKFNKSDNKFELRNANGNITDYHAKFSKGIALVFSETVKRDIEPENQQEGVICLDKGDGERKAVKKVFHEKFQSKLSWTGDICFGSLLVIFSFLSFLGNSCALVIFLFRHRKLTSAEVFFVNLAIVDILLSIVSYPIATAAAFRHRWDFGQIGCTIYGFTCYFLGVASISSVTSIALVRYFKTCDPVRGTRINCRTSGKILAVGYSVAFFWAAMPLGGFGNYEVEPYGLGCTLNWMATNSGSRIYIILVTIFVVLLPLFIIIFCYIQIVRVVRRSSLKMQINGVQKRHKSDVQLTWISALITIGFVVAWSPYAMVCLYSSFWGKLLLPIWATSLPTLLAKSSIVLNPVIYIFFTDRYRNDLVIQVKGWCSRTKKPKVKQLCY